MALTISLLGRVEFAVDGAPLTHGGVRERAVLAMLALRRCSSITPEQLLDLAWPGGDGSRASLYVHVHHLRRRLEPYADHLASGPAGYRLDGPELSVDLDRLAELALLVAECEGAGDREGVVRFAGEAEALFRGELCEDLLELDLTAERRVYAEQRLGLVDRRIAAELDLRPGDCVAELEALVMQHPYRERMWGLLMVALHHDQRQTEALATYRRARDTLLGQIGVEPGPLLQSLEQAILAGLDPAELLRAAPVASPGAALLWLDDRGAPRRRPLPMQGDIVIGRATGMHVCLANDDTVSRRHAAIRRTGSSWELMDLQSLNGTVLNGVAISGPVHVEAGDLIRCGSTMLLIAAPAASRRPIGIEGWRADRATQRLRQGSPFPSPRPPAEMAPEDAPA